MAQKLTDIDGLGNKNASRLKSFGIESIGDLAECDPEEVVNEVDGISESRLHGWRTAAARDAVVIKSGQQVADEYENLTKVSTGIDKLDNILGGGWDAGFMVAIGGETGSGKTQISFQALAEAVNQCEGEGIYIETERGRYRGKRIREMYDKETQEQNAKIPAYSLDQQELAYETILEEYTPSDLAFVVVDSFTSRFRMSDDFTGRQDLPDRHTVMSRHLDKLDKLAAA